MADENIESRFSRGGRVVNYPILKRILNRLGNRFIQLLFRNACDDISNASKIYRRTVNGSSDPFGGLGPRRVGVTFGMPDRYAVLSMPGLCTVYFARLLYGPRTVRDRVTNAFVVAALLALPFNVNQRLVDLVGRSFKLATD